MSKAAERLHEFGPFRLDAAEHVLLRSGQPVSLTPKAFDTPLALVQNSGHIVGKEELMRMVWPDTVVEENNLNQNISALRKVLGQGGEDQGYIETIPKRGYRFVADVRKLSDSAESAQLFVKKHSRAHLLIEEENAITARTALKSLIRMKKRAMALAIVTIGFLVAATLGLIRLIHQGKPIESFQKMRMTRLTSMGNVSFAAISPDGRYVAHVVETAGKQSLWIRQVATSSTVQMIPPGEAQYRGLTFSRDGNYVYYLRAESKDLSLSVLYRAPALGGDPRRLITDVDSPIALSPEGNRLAFVRNFANGENALTVANIDGAGQQKLSTRRFPESYAFGRSAGPAWSPDGKSVACAVENSDAGGHYMNVVEVQVKAGAETPITAHRWANVGQLVWLSDSSGLLMVATDEPSSPSQIWQLSYPGGEARRVTNDLNNYSGISLTADSRTLVTVQGDLLSTLWIAPDGDAGRAKQITTGTSRNDGARGISWTPDGKIVYSSNASGHQDLWITDPDGSNQKELIVDARLNFNPSVSPDGGHIIFVSNGSGSSSIWMADIDGSNARQLTNGNNEIWPRWSSDGRSVIYGSNASGNYALWRLAIEKGAPVQLTKPLSLRPAISPDGNLIAYSRWDEDSTPHFRLTIMRLRGGPAIEGLKVPNPSRNVICWTPDGSALNFIDTRGGVSNIWAQPIDGGPPRQLTEFKSDQIFFFDWSRDGKELALARGRATSDLVLIGNFE